MRAVGLAAFDSGEQHGARQRLTVLDEAAVSVGRSLDLVRSAQELTELVVPRFADFAGWRTRHTATEEKIIWAGQSLTDGDHQV